MIVEYMQRLQRILGDTTVERFNPFDLLDYINEARDFVASESECVTRLCPSTAPLQQLSITAGGTGYTSAPTVTISPPTVGTQATAAAQVFGGAVVGLVLLTGGSGYIPSQPPSVTFSGGGGSGATATAVVAPAAQVVAGREVYTYASFNSLLASLADGASQIVAIKSIAVSWGSMKPMLRRFPTFNDLQAYLRSYNVGVQGYTRAWAPLSYGTGGSFYVWPIPSQNSQMDIVCSCLPQPLDLNSNVQIEAISHPWTKAVPYKAAEIAVLGEPDLRDLADRYAAHYQRRMQWAAAVASPVVVPDYYDPAARL